MFSSLASFLFGSSTNCETNSETTAADTATATATGVGEQRDTIVNLLDDENFIEVTSLTPSVTGTGGRQPEFAIKRGKNRRNNARQQHKRKEIKAPLPLGLKQTNLLPSADNCDEEEFDEDEWFIVEKEGGEEKDVFPARNKAEGENVAGIEVDRSTKSAKAVADNNLYQQQRQQQINSHSLYSGPRPQKQRNFLQKTRKNTNNRLSVSTLSPSRTVNDGRRGSGHEATADAGIITRSLYVAPALAPHSDEKAIIATKAVEAVQKMDESWFVTPPPCFTSIGPINMETSPYENLLIEHPSMSVYHSIRRAEEAAVSFITLDLDENEKQEAVLKDTSKENSQIIQNHSAGVGYRLDRQSVAQLKQELMARNVQKIQTKKERKDICRTAINRANKVRHVQSRNYTKRRSDQQQSKIFSNANNNRKSNCC